MDLDVLEGFLFHDRQEAGAWLAARLHGYRDKPATVVLGLPRGGVVPAAEIAHTLGLPLDVVIVRKLGAPGCPELAIGALAEGDALYVDPGNARLTGATSDYIQAEVARQRATIAARRERFRDGRALVLAPGTTAILVDDGVATGATVIAAIRALRTQPLARLVLALPVAPPDTAARLRRAVDELVVLATPSEFRAVGQFYARFAQVSDDEVAALLAAARRPAPARAGAMAS